MTRAEMIGELKATKDCAGAIGFRMLGVPVRRVATLLAENLREQTGPYLSAMGGCYREEERQQFAEALERGELDDVLAEILKPPAADAAG